MEGNDPRRVVADNYISDAIKTLQAMRLKHLDHTDANTVKAALYCLDIVQRSIAGEVANDAQITARLRQLATEVEACFEPDSSIAYAAIETAAEIFQAMADRS